MNKTLLKSLLLGATIAVTIEFANAKTKTEIGSVTIDENLFDDIFSNAFSYNDTTSWKVPEHALKYMPIINAAEAKHGLPVGLLSRVAYIESNFNPNAYNSRSGAQGMFQIVPRWHPEARPYDWEHSAFYASNYLRELKNALGSWRDAVAAYNFGIGNIQSGKPLPKETRDYLVKVEQVINLA